MSKTSITSSCNLEGVPQNDGFVDDDEDDEIDIDDEFEEIEEEVFDDNNESGFK
jgi:hypothetical protein